MYLHYNQHTKSFELDSDGPGDQRAGVWQTLERLEKEMPFERFSKEWCLASKVVNCVLRELNSNYAKFPIKGETKLEKLHHNYKGEELAVPYADTVVVSTFLSSFFGFDVEVKHLKRSFHEHGYWNLPDCPAITCDHYHYEMLPQAPQGPQACSSQ